jgi:tRNA A-37 threonylcarbamoyl transferase component Bud32
MDQKKFGRYEIKAEIGRGGMATVYHAYDPRFEREVALKVLPREMLHDPQFRTRFEREAKTIAMLEHPAIVPVYDFGEEEGQPYFVMRYMNGGSLTDRMKKTAMTIEEVAHLYSRIAPALDEAHAKGIIHRDLKPGNILFDQYGEPYISDFGIAKIAATQSNVTGSAIIGTPAYMSPEQAQGEGIDGRSDIYGLGVILFELLSGRQPYQGDTPMSVVVKHITDPVPHILDVKADLDPAIEAVVEKAMAKDRTERFATVKALTDALNAVARGEPPDLEGSDKTLISTPGSTKTRLSIPGPRTGGIKPGQRPAPVSAGTVPPKKTGLWIGLGGGALLVCVALIAVIFLFRDKIPFLAAAPTATPLQISRNTDTPDVRPLAGTDTPGILPPVVPSDTPMPTATFTPSPSPTEQGMASIGGADLMAFLSDNDIYVMGVDGSNLKRITNDGGGKNGLQWSPDGQSVFYISGKCILSASLAGGSPTQVTCFNAATYLEAFEISPDGKQVAISVNRVLYVVPFDLTAIANARNGPQLQAIEGCITYNLDGTHPAPKGVRWSMDGRKIAANINSTEAGQKDVIRILEVSSMSDPFPKILDNFPAQRFTMTNYNVDKLIPSFDWDGYSLFVLNSTFRYDMGYLFEYNADSMHGKSLDPIKSTCCYAAARFSPDGSFLLFAYQNISQNAKTQLYYVSYGSIDTGLTYTPLALPDGFFSSPKDHLDAALRPANP